MGAHFEVRDHNAPVKYIFNGSGPRAAIAIKLSGAWYKQERDLALRTENTKEALESMDFSEFVHRVLMADHKPASGAASNTTALAVLLSDTKQFTKVDIPELGDIALWAGYTGIVGDVD